MYSWALILKYILPIFFLLAYLVYKNNVCYKHCYGCVWVCHLNFSQWYFVFTVLLVCLFFSFWLCRYVSVFLLCVLGITAHTLNFSYPISKVTKCRNILARDSDSSSFSHEPANFFYEGPNVKYFRILVSHVVSITSFSIILFLLLFLSPF